MIIFDEVQLLSKARQAIKYLVADGRYKYIETGSLISIKKNIIEEFVKQEGYSNISCSDSGDMPFNLYLSNLE